MELIVGKKYILKATTQLCHIVGDNSAYDKVKEYNPFIFVGKIDTQNAKDRCIFMSDKQASVYAMFSSINTEGYAKPFVIKVSLKELAEEYGVSVEEIEIIA